MQRRIIVATLALLSLPAAGVAESRTTAAPESRNVVNETKICFIQEGLGSRIGRVECKTKEQWASVGIDVDDRLKK